MYFNNLSSHSLSLSHTRAHTLRICIFMHHSFLKSIRMTQFQRWNDKSAMEYQMKLEMKKYLNEDFCRCSVGVYKNLFHS